MKSSPASKATRDAKAAYTPLTLKDKVLRVLGPGLITGASDDDRSGIATYSQAGAQFGFSITWTLLFIYPLMAAIQEISGRIGRITGKGIAANLRQHYPNWLLQSIVGLVLIANTINIGADLGASGYIRYGNSTRPFLEITQDTRIPASQCTRHFAQVGRIVGIEASPACHCLDGAIGRDEHEDWIANWVTVADPGQRPRRASGGKHPLTRVVQVTDEVVDSGGGLVVLSQHQHGRCRRDRCAWPVPQLGRAVTESRDSQDFGHLERDLADATEAVSSSHDKGRRRARRTVGPGRPVARERAGQSERQMSEAVVQIVVARQRRHQLRPGDHRQRDGLGRCDGVFGSRADRQDQLGRSGCGRVFVIDDGKRQCAKLARHLRGVDEIGTTPGLRHHDEQGIAHFRRPLVGSHDGRCGGGSEQAKPRIIVFCGRGSSGHIGVYLRYLFEARLGLLGSAAAPSVVTAYQRPPDMRGALFVVVSQSGRSPDLVDATQMARKFGALTLAIVNDENSPAAAASELVLPIGAGTEHAVAATKTVAL